MLEGEWRSKCKYGLCRNSYMDPLFNLGTSEFYWSLAGCAVLSGYVVERRV